MKKALCILAGIIVSINIIVAQNGAAIEYKITASKGVTGTNKIYFSDKGTRIEMQMIIPQMPGGGYNHVSIIKKEKPTTIYNLNDKSKTYTTTERPSNSDKSESCENCVVKIIGKEKVGNYNCIHATITKGAEVNDYWTSTEVPEYEKYSKENSGGKYMASGSEYAALAKGGAGGFIVKTIAKGGREGDVTLELVKFEKKENPSSLFEIPTDYKPATFSSPANSQPAIDAQKIQNMTPEERQKYIEEMKKQYGTKEGGK